METEPSKEQVFGNTDAVYIMLFSVALLACIYLKLHIHADSSKILLQSVVNYRDIIRYNITNMTSPEKEYHILELIHDSTKLQHNDSHKEQKGLPGNSASFTFGHHVSLTHCLVTHKI